MNSIKLSFENPWLLLLLIPCVAMVLLPYFLLAKERRRNVKRIVPLCMRALAVVLLILILSGVNIVNHTDKQAVMIVLDLSDSTAPVSAVMQSHAKELQSLLEKTTPVGVVAFGGNQVYQVPIDKKGNAKEPVKVDAAATDIASALEYAASLAPEKRALRMVLLTDGKQTDGNGDAVAYNLAKRGIRLDTLYYDSTLGDAPEVQIAGFHAPDGMYLTKDALFTLELKSSYKTEAQIALYEEQTLLEERTVQLEKGSNVFELTVKPEKTGLHTYRLRLTATEDTLVQNNVGTACVKVDGGASVLIVADKESRAASLSDLLSKTHSVTVVEAQNAPATMVELCQYDQVVLSNVDYYELPYNFDTVLERFVAEFGRGLLVVGGRQTLMYGNMDFSILKAMLPVEMELKEAGGGRSVALMLVLDCSSSMVGGNLSVAKQGAISSLTAMTSNDYVGIVSFNRHGTLAHPLVKANAENKQELTRVISMLTTGSGTYYAEALQIAYEELMKSSADIKHIMFLSDGKPSDDGKFDDVIEKAKDAAIPISTIGLGYSSSILDEMASITNGKSYYAAGMADLPEIMLSATEEARINSLIVAPTTPVVQVQSELTDALGKAEFPQLGGYLGTTIKEQATAYIETAAGHPLYAAWEYGKGTVSCFTSDLSGDWSANWFVDARASVLIDNMIKTTASDIPSASSLRVEKAVLGKNVEVSVLSAEAYHGHRVEMVVKKGSESETYSLTQLYAGSYKGTFPFAEAGVYTMTITEYDGYDKMVDSIETAVAVSYSNEYDAFAPDGKLLLSNMCSYSEGGILDSVAKAAAIRLPTFAIVYDPIIPLAILIAAMVLVDIAVRKIRLKDIRNFLVKLHLLSK